LKKNGYIVEAYSSIAPYDKRFFDNLTSRLSLSDLESQVLRQYIISGIRYMPLVLKRFFVNQYYQGQDYYHKDIVVFANHLGKTHVIDRQPTFKIYHLSGAHPPFQLDGALNQVDKGYIEQAASSLRIVTELIAELKNADGYDNSLIIIIGDHGSHDSWEYPGTTIAYSTQTLMLVKRINQHFEEIQFSDLRVSLADVPKSIAEELDIENSYPGYSIFEPIPPDRLRKFFYYQWRHSDWFADYIPLYEFEIEDLLLIGIHTLIGEHPGNNEAPDFLLWFTIW
jgi:hypothetical protein